MSGLDKLDHPEAQLDHPEAQLDHPEAQLDHPEARLDHPEARLDHPGTKKVVMVAAVADNGVIGKDGDIPWHLSEDLKHFRETTRGHTVVMGRTTYEGIGHPLPYRTNIVVTRNPDWNAEGVFVAGSVEEAVQLAQAFEGDVMIGGGTQVYEAAMPLATHQVLTEVHQSPEGDTHYPDFDRSEWKETRREERDGYAWVWLERANR